MAILIITHGNRTIRRELGDKPTIVGRDPGCDLFFADKRLSRQHARFEATEAGVRLLDLESRNGTWVNQTRIKEVILRPEDTIRIGSLTISLETAEPAVPETAPSEMPTTAKIPEGPDESLELIEDEEEPAHEQAGTVMLQPEAPPPPSESSKQDEAGTVMLSKAEPAEPPVPPTVPLQRPAELAPPAEKQEDEAGTVMQQTTPPKRKMPKPSCYRRPRWTDRPFLRQRLCRAPMI